MKIGDAICQIKITPEDYEGIGLFKPISFTVLVHVRDASLAERKRYFDLFPKVRLIACQRRGTKWFGCPASAGDSRFRMDSDVVIDAFDNSASRATVQNICRSANLECLHIGLYEDYCEVIRDEVYRVPADVDGDVCEYPLARNLVLLAVALASETLVKFLPGGEKLNRTATLRDFAVRDFESYYRISWHIRQQLIERSLFSVD